MTENEIRHYAESQSNIGNTILSLKNVLIAERFFGIFRFSIRGEKVLPSSWINKIYSFCVIAFSLATYIVFVKVAGLDTIVHEISYIPVQAQCLILAMTTTMFHNKDNGQIFGTLAELDNLLMITSREFYKKTSNMSSRFLGFLIASHIISSIADYMIDDIALTCEIFFYPVLLIPKLEALLFCLIIGILEKRVSIINGYLKKFLDEKDDTIFVSTSQKKDVKANKTKNVIGRPSNNNMKIRDLAIGYDLIGNICSKVNDIFNFQIFFTLLTTFCYMVITIWTCFYYYRNPAKYSGLLATIIMSCLTSTLTITAMCFVCERLRSKRITTRILVNEVIMDYDLPKIMREQAKAFMELIEEWPLHIFIYDMFSVDISLMLKFVSVSTTYLIVVIQVFHIK